MKFSNTSNNINLKKFKNNIKICNHITVTITNKKSTKINRINLINYFLAFINLTNQLADTNIVKKKHTTIDSFKMKTKLSLANAEKLLTFLSIYVLPNRQKFKKYTFNEDSNIISFHLEDWANLIPSHFPLVNNLYNQPSMQIVIVLNKKLSPENAHTFLSSKNFPIVEINKK